jgi:hypothetical protein
MLANPTLGKLDGKGMGIQGKGRHSVEFCDIFGESGPSYPGIVLALAPSGGLMFSGMDLACDPRARGLCGKTGLTSAG